MGNTFYNKYKLFQLNVVSISHGLANVGIGASLNDLNIIVRLKGLPFKNCNYNYLTNNKLNSANIAPFTFIRSATNIQQYNYNQYITFEKSIENVDLQIDYMPIISTFTPTIAYPDCVFIFSIIGIE